MADFGIGEIAMLALATASTAYSASQAGKTPDMPSAADVPKASTAQSAPTMDLSAQVKASNEASSSAGGTMLNKAPTEVSPPPSTLGTKTLLGS